ncbi:MAG: DNA helicase RecQ [Stagnimonas sp.]|nr:DNA helicase RecQ [Stagnimonas sp.]
MSLPLPPPPAASLGDPQLLSALKTHFGFDAFRPGQEAIVRDALLHRDLLAIMPTGGGKSLCFQLPALLMPGVMIVVSPLIALMQDQVRLLADNGIAATFLNSSLKGSEGSERMSALLRGEIKLLYLAPERLLMADFLEGFLPRLQQAQGISAFTIDEAHCVSEWGHDFRPEYRQMHLLRRHFPEVPVFAFTATATVRVRADIVRQLALIEPALHVASFDRPNLFYTVTPKSSKTYGALLTQAKKGGAGIVYCLSRKRVNELTERLQGDGIAALPYHAGLDAEMRRKNQDTFIRDDVGVMVATVAFGMGINKPDVRWVVHYELPKSLEGYYQEAGRAGRDGEPAQCTLYFGPGDILTAEFFIAQKVHPATGEPLVDEQRNARQQLKQVLDYAETSACRRSVQLRYFGEDFSGPCGACDNCTSTRVEEDWTVPAQQLLSTIARLAKLSQRFGAGHIIEILRGAKTEKLIRQNHEALSTYGIGSDKSADEWRHLVRVLKHQNLLEETQDGYPVLLLNAGSWLVLRGLQTVTLVAAPKPEKEKREKKSRSKSAAEVPVLGSAEEQLFQRLRTLRKKLADEQGVPPYVVFADAALRAMAQTQPTSLTTFAEIPGVGAAKLAHYGEAFTAEIIEAIAAR